MAGKGFENLMRAAGKAVSRTIRETTTVERSEAVDVPLTAEELALLDGWISRQADPKPSRPEAIRKLLAIALPG